MGRFLLAATLCIGALIAGIPAQAATIFVTENEMGPFGTNTYNGGTLNWSSFFSAGNGQMILTANAGSSPGLPTFKLPVWCIDQPGFIGLGLNPGADGNPIVYTVEPLADFTTDFSGHSITARQQSPILNTAQLRTAVLQ
jgi:hypothetical protein